MAMRVPARGLLGHATTSIRRTQLTGRRWKTAWHAYHPTPIEKMVVSNIKSSGPISFGTYMRLCLSHPTHGYYMDSYNPIFGAKGDFITSPEISQAFGELIGIWFFNQWVNADCPTNIRLVELGPGRGTLIDDILRTIYKLRPLKHELVNVHLIETSQKLRTMQAKKLHRPKLNIKFHWHDSISEIPPSPSEYTMLIAHEFFDALPIHILQKKETGWHEVMVDFDTSKDAKAGDVPRLRRVLSPAPTAISTVLGLSSKRFQHVPVESFIEVSPAAFKTARRVAELVAGTSQAPSQLRATSSNLSVGGAGLIIDYGGDRVYGDSFRAFSKHRIVDVLHRPGECDLTANVDFAYLKEAMSDLVTLHGPITQRRFLQLSGIGQHTEASMRTAKTKAQQSAIMDSMLRLVDKEGMGSQYQVLGVTSMNRHDGQIGTGVFPFEVPDSEGEVEDRVQVDPID